MKRKSFAIWMIITLLNIGLFSACSNTITFNMPEEAAKSITQVNSTERVIIDHKEYENDEHLFILYDTKEESVTYTLVSKKAKDKYYINEYEEWYSLKNDIDDENKIKGNYPIFQGAIEINSEEVEFLIWKGENTQEDFKERLGDLYYQINIPEIEELYSNIFIYYL